MQTRLTDIEKPFNIMFFILFSSLTKMIFMYAWECLVLSPVAGSCLAHSLLVQSLVASLPGSFTFIVTHKKYAGPHRAEERGGRGGARLEWGRPSIHHSIIVPKIHTHLAEAVIYCMELQVTAYFSTTRRVVGVFLWLSCFIQQINWEAVIDLFTWHFTLAM